MCGISGLINHSDPISSQILEDMNRAITHRGPDDEGYFIDGPVGLAHRRLSIIDLSHGHQPMYSDDDRFVIVFNGEIYNFQNIRKDLEKTGITFKTNCDTEVLLKLYILKKENCLQDLNGMFAFAIWDKIEKKLFAARDRFGKKPFYFWKNQKHFSFSSECKSFLKHPEFSPEVDQKAIRYFLQYEYVPAPFCIFKGVKKLPQAHYLTWKQNEEPVIQRYWEIPLKNEKPETTEAEAEKRIFELLEEATTTRLVSDVPLGVFLSGGIDSSSIVGMMARHRQGKDIKTFSIGFEEKSFDESEYASQIAKHFNTDHHHQTLTPKKLIEILPEVTNFMDEPFADASIIPTYLLSKFTREHVTVALGGDGSDELFAGYPTFFANKHADTFQKFPKFIQSMINKIGWSLPVSHKNMSFDFKVKQFLYGASFPKDHRQQIWLGAFHQAEQENLFLEKSSENFNPIHLVDEELKYCQSQNPDDRSLYFYEKFYLTDDILVKTDRASMASSLEVRAPYLDVNLAEYVSTLPFHFKLKGNETKYILKKSLEKLLPHNILYRPKKGFGIPISIWLKEDLKDQISHFLSPEFIKKQGIFNSQEITRLLQEHLQGKQNHRKKLFSLFMFQNWYENFINS